MLTLIHKVPPRKALYRCDCGNETIVFRSNVTTGHTKSCGCLRRIITSERSKTHGQKSGYGRTRAYATWVNMKSRCSNPNRPDFVNYGGRGITYAPEWNHFEQFFADMGEPPIGLTLDRQDNSLGYSKDNCRWVSRAVQNSNKRNTVNLNA